MERRSMSPDFDIRIMNPLILLLSPEVNVRLHLADPPPPEIIAARVKKLVRGLKPEERQGILARAKVLTAYANAVQNSLCEGEFGRNCAFLSDEPVNPNWRSF